MGQFPRVVIRNPSRKQPRRVLRSGVRNTPRELVDVGDVHSNRSERLCFLLTWRVRKAQDEYLVLFYLTDKILESANAGSIRFCDFKSTFWGEAESPLMLIPTNLSVFNVFEEGQRSEKQRAAQKLVSVLISREIATQRARNIVRNHALTIAERQPRNVPPVAFITALTIFALAASMSASVSVFSFGCSVTSIARLFLPACMRSPR